MQRLRAKTLSGPYIDVSPPWIGRSLTSPRIMLDGSQCHVALRCLLCCTMTLLVLQNIAGQVKS